MIIRTINRPKAQVSIEFLFFVSVSLLILSTYTIYVVKNQVSYSERISESRMNYWLDKIKWYMDYAYVAGKGFHTFLELPSDIDGKQYNISLSGNGFVLEIDNTSYYRSIIAYNVSGMFYPGELNEIVNDGGGLYVKRAGD